MNRTKAVQTNLTPDEYKRLVASARFHNRTIADYVRLCILEQVNKDWQVQQAVIHPEPNGEVPKTPRPIDPELAAKLKAKLTDPKRALGVTMIQEVLGLIIENFTEDNIDIEKTYFEAYKGTEIKMPCHPIGHLLMAVQGNILKLGWAEDAQQWLSPVADYRTIRLLCQAAWPTQWFNAFCEREVATGINTTKGDPLFIPSLDNIKSIFSVLAIGQLSAPAPDPW